MKKYAIRVRYCTVRTMQTDTGYLARTETGETFVTTDKEDAEERARELKSRNNPGSQTFVDYEVEEYNY